MVLPRQVLIFDPNAVPPASAQSYGVSAFIESKDDNDFVRSQVATSPDGSVSILTFDAAGDLTDVSFVVLTDGSVAMQKGPTSIGFNADGDAVISGANGGTIKAAADGTITASTTTGTGLRIDPDGTIDLNGIVVINPDFTYALNGAQWIEATAAGLNLHLPTADPVSAGALWNDTGTVKVSAG